MRALLLTTLALAVPSTAAAYPLAQPVGYGPLTNQQAASMVFPTAWEPRPQNASENAAQPTPAQVQAWRSPPEVQWNPNIYYVNGRYSGTTDEIIQWAAAKWGFHSRLLRAAAVTESYWDMDQLGDFNQQIGEYDSYGLYQMKRPFAYTTPHIALPRDYTAFNADYYGGILRTYFDGEQTWLNDVERGQDYVPGDVWGSVGAWYSGRWHTPAAEGYIATVKRHYNDRTWRQPGF